MNPLLADSISVCYLASGFGVAAVYVPRIRRMLRDEGATATSHSLFAEFLWAVCRLVSLAYVALVALQPLITLVVGLDVLGRVVMVAVIARARSRSPAFVHPT